MASTKSKDLKKEGQIISTEDMFKDNSYIAFVIDGEVVHTFICDKRMAAILQSNPQIIEVNAKNPFLEGPHIGWKYDGNKFINNCIDETHDH